MRVALVGAAVGAAAIAALSAFALGQTPAGTERTPGGRLEIVGELTDGSSGEVYGFELVAEEDSAEPGLGSTWFRLSGPGLAVSDAHPARAAIPIGSRPLAELEIAGADGVSVEVNGCEAVIETHGILSSRHPHVAYVGPATIDLEVAVQPAAIELSLTIYTPKRPVELSGRVAFTSLAMDTCALVAPPGSR